MNVLIQCHSKFISIMKTKGKIVTFKKARTIVLFVFSLMLSYNAFAQGAAINATGAPAHPSAMLDVSGTTSGVLINRMTTAKRDSIAIVCACTPAEGLLIFNTNTKCFETYVNGIWQSIWCPCAPVPASVSISASPSGAVCSGTSVTFTATPVNGGTLPAYQWYNGGSVISGATNATWTSTTLANNDNITCVMTSNAACVTGSPATSNQVTMTVNALPAAPTAGTHTPAQTQIVWNWNIVGGAIGYQWNTSNTYPGAGVNLVGSPSYTQPGLLCNTAYTLYVWAVNACGNSSYVTLTQTTSACSGWTCGDPLTITHAAGAVCPESKTVNYGTVLSGLSGSSHCWITQNLGADHSASSATADMTNASAGWYWQFNRIQGYLPNPTVVIPSGFLGSISENSDWIPANDPCTSQLGAGWRIPTYTEWLNTETNAGWNNVTDAFNSVLKIHLGGNVSGGSLTQRGVNGLMWCSTSANAGGSYTLFETAASSYVTGGTMGKVYGYSLRCIK
jgi:hypothetical protein